MKIAEQIVDEFVFEIECYSSEEFDEFRNMMTWISDNCCNGRIHFNFEGGMLANKQHRMWMRGRIIFTNDIDGSDGAAFKLRWL